jgi:hypothetical protein
MKRLQGKLTYANVVATLALFVALGGSSYAALTITGREVKDGSLTGRDVQRNSLGGKRIKESKLGTVRRARNAFKLDGLTARQLLLKCPPDTLPSADICIETAPRSAAPFGLAQIACSQSDTPRTPGRRLPSYVELLSAQSHQAISVSPGGELTSEVYPRSEDDRVNALAMITETGGVEVVPDTPAGARAYRCASDPLN